MNRLFVLISFVFIGSTELVAETKKPPYTPVTTHLGSLKASYSYTTLNVTTTFKIPAFGFGKRIRYEYTALDISTHVSTTFATSVIHVDTSCLGYLFRDIIYIGAGGGVSISLKKLTLDSLGINPIVKLGLELSKSFHQINYTPFTVKDWVIDRSPLVSYQLGFKY